jgi:PII-like signaling protein
MLPSPRVLLVVERAPSRIDRAVDLRTKGKSKMQIPEKASLLRIFIGEDDKADGRPLYEAIVLKAREVHLAGATVLRGPLGFGRSSMLHTAKVLRLSQDLPVIVEIVDTEEKINGFLPILTELTKSCLITLEKVTVIRYGEDESGLAPEHTSTSS